MKNKYNSNSILEMLNNLENAINNLNIPMNDIIEFYENDFSQFEDYEINKDFYDHFSDEFENLEVNHYDLVNSLEELRSIVHKEFRD